jgi:hypothetical protein
MSKSKEVHRQRKSEGKPVNQMVPLGKKAVGTGINRRFVRDPSQLKYFRLVRILREVHGLSFEKISDRMEALLSSKEGRQPTPRVHFKLRRAWSKHRVRDCYNTMDNLLPRYSPSERRKIWNRRER